MYQEKELNERMGKVVDYAQDEIKENPMLYVAVGSILDEEGVASAHLSCVASTKMNKLDPEKECYKVVATALKGIIRFLEDALGNEEHASEVFTAGLLEALAQTKSGILRESESEGDDEITKYGFRRIKE